MLQGLDQLRDFRVFRFGECLRGGCPLARRPDLDVESPEHRAHHLLRSLDLVYELFYVRVAVRLLQRRAERHELLNLARERAVVDQQTLRGKYDADARGGRGDDLNLLGVQLGFRVRVNRCRDLPRVRDLEFAQQIRGRGRGAGGRAVDASLLLRLGRLQPHVRRRGSGARGNKIPDCRTRHKFGVQIVCKCTRTCTCT